MDISVQTQPEESAEESVLKKRREEDVRALRRLLDRELSFWTRPQSNQTIATTFLTVSLGLLAVQGTDEMEDTVVRFARVVDASKDNSDSLGVVVARNIARLGIFPCCDRVVASIQPRDHSFTRLSIFNVLGFPFLWFFACL